MNYFLFTDLCAYVGNVSSSFSFFILHIYTWFLLFRFHLLSRANLFCFWQIANDIVPFNLNDWWETKHCAWSNRAKNNLNVIPEVISLFLSVKIQSSHSSDFFILLTSHSSSHSLKILISTCLNSTITHSRLITFDLNNK